MRHTYTNICAKNHFTDLWCCLSPGIKLLDPNNPAVLIEGVLFRAKYLGSTQLISEGQPSKAMRMMQAQEAVGRIKVIISSPTIICNRYE